MAEQERKGMVWEFGQPYISRGIVYPAPNIKVERKFEENVQELKKPLFEKLKKYYSDFGFTTKYYPRLSENTREGIISFQVGDDCACFKFENSLSHLVHEHNLDHAYQKVIAFNTASDLVEILDEEILVPRVKGDDKNVRVEYPLPNNIAKLPEYVKTWIESEMFQKIMKASGLEKYTLGNDSIETRNGKIFIENGLVIGGGFDGFALNEITFPISKIVEYAGHPEWAPDSTTN